MRILFDYQIFALQSFGGISRYYCELFRILRKIGLNARLFVPFHINHYLSDYQLDSDVGQKIPNLGKAMYFVRKLNGGITSLFLKKFKPAILHETYFRFERYPDYGQRTVTTVYDMTMEKFFDPQLKDPESQKKLASVKRADKIICISDNTRKDLCDVLGVNPEKTSVIYLATSMQKPDKSLHPFEGRPYLLFVGNREGYKNFELLLRAYCSSAILQNEFLLVCCGGQPFSEAEVMFFRDNHIQDKVIHLAGNDKNLVQCYSQARGFIFPSKYEGFGIPILEAMNCDCPVLCSNTSSFPEVAGDAAKYFDPESVDDLQDKLEKTLFDDTAINELIRRGKMRRADFSWEKCAEQTQMFYQSLLDGKL